MFKKLIYVIILFVFTLSSCEEGIFPQTEKTELPAGHNYPEKTAYHMKDKFYPYGYNIETGEQNCASVRCHQPNLKGGISRENNKIKYAPSCYQCHGKLWYNKE